jgi:septum formation protein
MPVNLAEVGSFAMIRQNECVDKRLVLASKSPRRKRLLAQLGVNFDIRVPSVDESQQRNEQPEEYAARISSAKAQAVTGDVVLGADTCVSLNGTIFGKPSDLDHAEVILKELSGKTHQVITGIAVQFDDHLLSEVVKTDVEFVELDQTVIDWYLSLGESLDKAGAYGLQGAGGAFVNAIRGSHSNVIGLPLVETANLLRVAGIDLMHTGKSGRR